jgi:hypothetical protein
MSDPTGASVQCTSSITQTTWIRFADLTLHTGPDFLHRGQPAYLGYGLSPRRLTEPALQVHALPDDLNSVILSHLHGDHWHRTARRHLDRTAARAGHPRREPR